MTTKSTGPFTIADVAEILEATDVWEAWRLENGSASVADFKGNRAALTPHGAGQVLIEMDLASDAGPFTVAARLAVDETAGALTIARMILAAAATEED